MDDALFIDTIRSRWPGVHWEAIFRGRRREGAALVPSHERDPVTGADTDNRALRIRVVGATWYLDSLTRRSREQDAHEQERGPRWAGYHVTRL